MSDHLQDVDVAAGVARKLAQAAAQYHTAAGSALVQSARLAFLDTVGCMIAGADDEATVGATAITQSVAGKCTVFGQGWLRSAPDAALINGTAAHALDFDDACTTALGHTSAVLVPALIAMAEAEDLSGAALVDGFVVGVEVQDRLGRLFNPEHYAAGWHSTSTLCAIGAAAGCAHLLGLGTEGILAAISNCSSMAGGSKKQIGSAMKPIHAGLAARAGVEAALLARAGVSGDPEPLAGAWGMLRQFNANPDAIRVAQVMADLRMGSALREGVLQMKRFPCCAATHKSLDGVMELLRDQGVDPASVEQIETWVPADLVANLRYHHPKNITEARFSMAYCATRILDTGALRLGDFALPALTQFATPDRLSKVKMYGVESGDDPMGAPVRTRMTLASGAQIETTITHTKGSTQRPLSDAEVFGKFVDCCVHAGCDAQEAATWGALINSLPQAARTQDVMAGLRSH